MVVLSVFLQDDCVLLGCLGASPVGLSLILEVSWGGRVDVLVSDMGCVMGQGADVMILVLLMNCIFGG